MLWLSWPTANGGDVQFIADTLFVESRDGYTALQWNAGDHSTFELQQSSDPDFSNTTTIYKGPDRASFISGLNDGIYYFRIRGLSGSWSDTLCLSVNHQSLSLALFLAGIGMVVFLVTVWVVVTGSLRTSIHNN